MRKSGVALIGVIGIVGIGLVIGWPYIRMEFASSAYYTRENQRQYEYYTPELLKKCQGYQVIINLNLGGLQAQKLMSSL